MGVELDLAQQRITQLLETPQLGANKSWLVRWPLLEGSSFLGSGNLSCGSPCVIVIAQRYPEKRALIVSQAFRSPRGTHAHTGLIRSKDFYSANSRSSIFLALGLLFAVIVWLTIELMCHFYVYRNKPLLFASKSHTYMHISVATSGDYQENLLSSLYFLLTIS